jgi:antitoxin VapB
MDRAIAKVFVTGRSQAIRIPKEFRFECEEVYIERHGDQVILTPKPKSWEEYFATSKRFTKDFPDHIEDELPEEREALG